jgi:hypothetical protein
MWYVTVKRLVRAMIGDSLMDVQRRSNELETVAGRIHFV